MLHIMSMNPMTESKPCMQEEVAVVLVSAQERESKYQQP